MNHNPTYRPGRGNEDGFALFAVIIFAVIVGLSGLAFFSMASYEFKSAENQQRSSEAFYLADGAVELARGALLEDITWRGPVPTTLLGRGNYTLSIVDTVVNGEDALILRGSGFVDESARGVETLAEVKPLLEVVGVFAGDDLTATGGLTLSGHAHVNGAADFGAGDNQLKAGTYDEGYEIYPPAIFVGPDNFPNSTYYRVVATSRSPGRARVYQYDHGSGDWIYVTRDSLGPSIVSYAANAYTFSFGNKTESLFSTVGNSLFKLDNSSSHDYVVVDFGHPDDASLSISNVNLGAASETWLMEATIVNTRFEGDPDPGDSRRVEPCGSWWQGGSIVWDSGLTFAPRGCVALVSNQLGPIQANAQGRLGTSTRPALTYVTGTVHGIKGAREIHGALIALCDLTWTGGPNVFYNPDFLDCLPEGVLGLGGAGFLQFLQWREVGL